MRRILLSLLLGILLCAAPSFAATCPVSITSPANNATVSGPTALTATYTQANCPSAVRAEWKINGFPLPGNGTFEYSYAIPSCAAGTCTASYSAPDGYGNYNASWLWDGNWPLTVQLLDSAGTVLATSASVNMVVQDYGFGFCTFNIGGTPFLSNGTFAATLSGSISLTLHCPLTGVAGTAWANALYNGYVDGVEIGASAHLETGWPDITWPIDTTTLENGPHEVLALSAGCDTANCPSYPNGNIGSAFIGVFGIITTCNSTACGGSGNSFRELRMNYNRAYLWLGANTTVSLFARSVFDDNTESATNATFTTDTPSVATVGSCTSVANCTITGIAQGTAIITATDASGHTETTRVVVQPGTPIFPHFGYDGSVCTAYNAGNCSPNKSQYVRGMFDGGSNVDADANLAHALALNGFNVFEHPAWPADLSYLALSSWGANDFDASITNYINLALSRGPFKSFWGRCESFFNNGPLAQYYGGGGNSNVAAMAAYASSKLNGKIQACTDGDEIAIPFTGSLSGVQGQIGSVSGPSKIVVTAGTPNLATVTWTNTKTMAYHVDLTGADNTCFLADGPFGDGTYVPVAGGLPGPFTFSTTCAVGTYEPSGGTITEAHIVFNIYNDLCGKQGTQNTTVCEDYGPLNRAQNVTGKIAGQNYAWGFPNYIQTQSGTATFVWPGFDATGPLQVDLANANVGTCLNGTNIPLTRASQNTYTFTTTCGNAIYGPNYGTPPNNETNLTFHLHCSGCTINGPLNTAVPNSILVNARNVWQSFTPKVPMDWPWAAGAYPALYQLSAGMGDFTNIYWTRDGSESEGEYYGYPQGHPHRVWLLSLEQDFWVKAWPGINQAQPWITITQSTGPWYTRGGVTYNISTAVGSQITTTAPNVAVVGSKITMVGANCTDSYNGAGAQVPYGHGVVGDVISIQSSTQFTISQSPGCTAGAAGTVTITPHTHHYFDPPYDKLKKPGLRAIEAPPIMWLCIALGCAGDRLYNYGTSNASPTSFSDYPAPLIPQGTGLNLSSDSYRSIFGQVPPDNPNNENNNTAETYLTTDNPSAGERWRAVGVAHALIAALEPQILQPLCHAPDFGPHFHTGAKCSAAGTLVIAINDSEVPVTLTFPTSVWSLYNTGNAPVSRFQEIKAAYVQTTNIAGSATSDQFVSDGGEIDIWWFPSSAPLAPMATIGFNPASVGGTQTAFRYSYLCTPTTFASNLDQQAPHIVFGTNVSIPLMKAGSPVCYDYQYLDASNVPVGAKSNVQVLK